MPLGLFFLQPACHPRSHVNCPGVPCLAPSEDETGSETVAMAVTQSSLQAGEPRSRPEDQGLSAPPSKRPRRTTRDSTTNLDLMAAYPVPVPVATLTQVPRHLAVAAVIPLDVVDAGVQTGPAESEVQSGPRASPSMSCTHLALPLLPPLVLPKPEDTALEPQLRDLLADLAPTWTTLAAEELRCPRLGTPGSEEGLNEILSFFDSY